MKSKALIFILIYLILATFFCLQIALAKTSERQHLHVLKESGQHDKAYSEYKSAIAKDPESIPLVLDFVELLVRMERLDESWTWLEKIGPEDINAMDDDNKRRVALLKAQIFVKREEFDAAISEIDPFVDSRDDQLLIADVYLMGGQWKESLRILKEVGGSIYYTPYERGLAQKKTATIRRYYFPRISADGGIVDSKTYGTIPWGSVSGAVPIGANNRLTTSYLWFDDASIFSVALNTFHKGFPPVDSCEFLLSVTDDGDGGGSITKTFYPTKRSHLEVRGFYNEVEREITSLMDLFSLKKGGSLGMDYRVSDTLTASAEYEYSDYTHDAGEMHTVNVGATYVQHLPAERPIGRHTVALLLIEGNGDERYIPPHLCMPSYTFGLSYLVSDEYSDHIDVKIGLGYLFGIDNEGFSFSPGCLFDYHVHRDVSISGGAEYRLDEVSGDGEWRINGGVEILF